MSRRLLLAVGGRIVDPPRAADIDAAAMSERLGIPLADVDRYIAELLRDGWLVETPS